VKVKEGFTPMAEFLMGDVGVVENWEEALHWTKNDGGFGTLVTLEGDILERSGVMSGGSRDQGLGLLERRREIRELERRVEETEDECRKAYDEEERLQRKIEEKETQLEERRKEIQEKEIELLHQERDLEGLKKEISQIHQKIEVIQFEQKQLEAEHQDLDEEKKEVSAQMEREEAAKREREEQVQSWKKKVEEVMEGYEELGGKMTEKKVFLASLEEKQKGLEGQTKNLSENQRILKDQVLKKVKGIRECREEAASLHEKIEQWEKELEDGLKYYRLQEEMLSTLKEKVETLSNEWREAEASSKYLRKELEEVRQKIHEEEILASEVQLKLSHLQESIRERYGAMLSTSIGAPPGEAPREEMSKRLAELKGALEGFGEVNLMAIEEYQELKQRHDFLSGQQADLHQALDSLKKAILRINRTTTKRFLETFHLVNEKFKEVFTRLFKGGQASLILLDEQDPSTTGIDIIAQPPGKKLQNIDLLSGGEKALVATALLFGIFMIKPTPFCLLDEVDAPLDDANINRFIELVKEFSKTSQFILITHNKSSMEAAHTLYGITMETPGVSKVVSVRLN
jgi:chromosome segregation protein